MKINPLEVFTPTPLAPGLPLTLERWVIVPVNVECLGKKVLVTHNSQQEAADQLAEIPSSIRDRYAVRRATITLHP